MNDPFAILGVSQDAYKREIQERYEILRSVWDPSKQSDPVLRSRAEVELAKIEEAYAKLVDPKQRVIEQYAERDGSNPDIPQKQTPPPPQPVHPQPTISQPQSVPNMAQPSAPTSRVITISQGEEKNISGWQKYWWAFAGVAFIFAALYLNMYKVMLDVAAERNGYYGRMLTLENRVSELESQNNTLQTQKDALQSKYDWSINLSQVGYCPDSIDLNSPDVAYNFEYFVNYIYNQSDSNAIVDGVVSDTGELSRVRVWYENDNYLEDFYYYSDEVLIGYNLPTNVFWSTAGCWLR